MLRLKFVEEKNRHFMYYTAFEEKTLPLERKKIVHSWCVEDEHKIDALNKVSDQLKFNIFMLTPSNLFFSEALLHRQEPYFIHFTFCLCSYAGNLLRCSFIPFSVALFIVNLPIRQSFERQSNRIAINVIEWTEGLLHHSHSQGMFFPSTLARKTHGSKRKLKHLSPFCIIFFST